MPEEKLVKALATKDVYHYVDENNGIDIKSKEIFKKTKKIVHYPFYRNGRAKYRKIKKITFVDFDNEYKLPRGFYKTWKKGYGFTRIYIPLLRKIEDLFDVNEIVIGNGFRSRVKDKKLYLNFDKLEEFFSKISILDRKGRKEKDYLIDSFFENILPKRDLKNIQKDRNYYIPGSLSTIVDMFFISKGGRLSDNDEIATFKLFSFLAPKTYRVNKKKILTTKDEIEKYYIEDVLKTFKKLLKLKRKTKNLEEKWQKFFKEYHWIFSQLFSTPVIIFKSKAYVGGKSIENIGGKIADFIYRNEFTNNVAIIELKTHLSRLLKRTPYRGEDVFAMDDELSGGIAQLLDQKQTLMREFNQLIHNATKKEIEAYNPKCILIIGMIKNLTENQKKSFELIRSNSKDVEVVTFDELLRKLEGLKEIILGDV